MTASALAALKRDRLRLEHVLANDYWPDDPRYAYVHTDYVNARDKHRNCVQTAWDVRKLERLAEAWASGNARRVA